MIVLYILGALLLLLVLLLILPLKVELSFFEDFKVKVKFLGFTLYPQKPKNEKKATREKSDETKPNLKEKNLFEKLVEKREFKGAINELFTLFKAVIIPLKKFLKRIKFRNIKVSIVVAGDDAAQTAINYGTVCSAVYPVLSIFQNIANSKYKKIDVTSNFESGKSSFEFSLDVKASIWVLLIFGFKIFKEYKNFCVRNDL